MSRQMAKPQGEARIAVRVCRDHCWGSALAKPGPRYGGEGRVPHAESIRSLTTNTDEASSSRSALRPTWLE